MPAARIFLELIADFVVYLGLLVRRRKAVAAENLFLRRQLALYQERKVDPRRIDPATRITLALLSKLFNWRDALVVVQPKTLIRWHRAGFRLLWHWKSKPGRPPIPAELRRLIREMSRDNLLWARRRRLLYWNVTSNPTAAWTLQQLREAIASEHPYRFLVHDRDSIYTQALDTSIANLRLRVLKIPYRSPKANSLCERLIGSLRRECLDWAIPLSEGHLRSLLKMWSTYYNRGRPHMALGPGVPDPPRGVPAPLRPHRHPLSASRAVVAKPVLNGLHHDYRLAPCSA
jgi:Integrase core domain